MSAQTLPSPAIDIIEGLDTAKVRVSVCRRGFDYLASRDFPAKRREEEMKDKKVSRTEGRTPSSRLRGVNVKPLHHTGLVLDASGCGVCSFEGQIEGKCSLPCSTPDLDVLPGTCLQCRYTVM